MQAIRISQQLETVLTVVVSVLCLVVLVVGLASMLNAGAPPVAEVREARLDTVVITRHADHKVARTDASAAVLPLVQ